MPKSNTRAALATAGIVIGCLFGGLVAGSAIAVGPTILAPVGLSARGEVVAAPMPSPSYSANDEGLTYGSALDAPSPETEPDLIQAVSDDGTEGYVLKTDLDDADGTAAAASFTSPEDAVKWQARRALETVTIPVYAVDGRTVIGKFTVAAPPATSPVSTVEQ